MWQNGGNPAIFLWRFMRKLIPHFLSLKGSINRRKYWVSHLFLVLCYVCLVFGISHIPETVDVKYSDALTVLVMLGILLPIYSSLCLHCKRLEDIQQSGRSYLKFPEFLKPFAVRRSDFGCFGCLLFKFYLMFCFLMVFIFPFYIAYVCAFRAGQKQTAKGSTPPNL